MKTNHRTYGWLLLALALLLTSSALWAEEDGKGTNVVRNLRVNDGGSMTLGGTLITNWAAVASTSSVSLGAFTTWSNDVKGATGVLNSATSSLNTAVGDLRGATGALNSATGSLNTAVALVTTQIFAGAGTTGRITSTTSDNDTKYLMGNGLWGTPAGDGDFMADGSVPMTGNLNGGGNNATNFANINALIAATQALNSATGSLNTALSGKLDLAGGTLTGNLVVTNVTSKGNTIYTPALQQTVGGAVNIAPAGLTYVKIIGTSDIVTLDDPQITAGTAGQIIVVQGNDETLRVKLTNSASLVLSTGLYFVMGSNDIIQLVYNGGSWVETHRADK